MTTRSRIGATGALVAVIATAAIAIVGTHASASVKTAASAKAAPTVSLRKTKLGKILVDSKGRTLYLFEKDKTSKSKCSGECATDWPPLTVKGTPTAGTGVKGSLLKTSKRSGGARQVTYNGHPVYRFEGDTKAGQTKGEGLDAFGAEWYVMNAGGKKVDNDG
jgi:predicted lipoprotein with Yx(FWY)xxD motif